MCGIEVEIVKSESDGVELEVPGVTISEEVAIARFFATESSLIGKTANEQALID